MEEIYRVISRNIKKYRNIRHLTQEELATLSELCPTTIFTLESTNKEHNCTIEVLRKISVSLGIPITALLEEDELEYSYNYDSTSLKNIKAVFYPTIHPDYEITSLLELVLYLPLIDMSDLYSNLLCRLDGQVINYEQYAASLIQKIIKDIPPSEALSYVYENISMIHSIRKGKEFDFSSDDLLKYHKSYHQILERNRKYFDLLSELRDFK